MRYEVLLTAGAERDLEAIYDAIAGRDSEGKAAAVLDRLMEVADLERYPERGGHPRELQALGILDFRQAHFKPYRLIYRVMGAQVVVHLIVDGRRDLQAVLAARLLGG